jgi:hypothetical protein
MLLSNEQLTGSGHRVSRQGILPAMLSARNKLEGKIEEIHFGGLWPMS